MLLSFVLNTLTSAILAGVKCVLRVSKALFLLLIIQSTAIGAVAPGTIITNTASIIYTPGLGSPITLMTNTSEFTVESILPANTAEITVKGHENRHMYPGSSVVLTVDITNTGSNDLNNGYAYIRTPANSIITLTGKGAVRSSALVRSPTTQLFLVANIAPGDTETYQLKVTLPLDVDIDDDTLLVQYQANNLDIVNDSINFEINPRTEAKLSLLHYSNEDDATDIAINPTEYMAEDGEFYAMPPSDMQATGTLSLKEGREFSHKQLIFIRLEDGDQNVDPTQTETIEINLSIDENGESERLRLTETGTNTGLFSGYVALEVRSVTARGGTLEVQTNTEVIINYRDQIDLGDARAEIALIDPYGVVFDSATGEAMDGYTVHLVDAVTGLPAIVYGDDGISRYPATLTTGGSVTDSSGQIYNFAQGTYRFPFAPAGNYKIIVIPPQGALYLWPSTKTTELMNQLPDAPFAITLGSRGEEFPLIAGPPLHIDIPVDRSEAPIYIQRTANKDNAAAGDFIQYEINIENIADLTINNVMLTDTLPRGFRLEEKSLLINGQPSSLPSYSENGSQLTFALGNIASKEIQTIKYVASLGAIASRSLISTSSAIANSGAAQSNTAEHKIQITDELMRNRSILMGQVIIDPTNDQENNEDKAVKNLAGVRIYMEDGRYAITDKNGMYHFDDITPGSHILQLDLDTLPSQYEVTLNNGNSRFAGRAWSQFVDIQGGTLWRTDFHVALKMRPVGSANVQISNTTEQTKNQITYHVDLSANTIDISNLRLTVMIPEHTRFVNDSALANGKTINDPRITDNMLIFRLGDFSGDWNQRISFKVTDIMTGASTELVTKASMLFNTPTKNNQRTPLASHSLILIKQEQKADAILQNFVINPHFELGSAKMRQSDIKAIKIFANKLKGRRDIRIHTIGHTNNIPLSPQQDNPFKTNLTVSAERAKIVADLLRNILQLTPGQVTIEGKGATQPLGDNNTQEGRKLNNRVHVVLYKEAKNHVELALPETATSGEKQSVTIKGLRPGMDKEQTKNQKYVTDKINYDATWLTEKNSDFEWISPHDKALSQSMGIEVLVKHHKNERVNARINGEAIDINFDGSINNRQEAKLSRWRGANLVIGHNTIELDRRNKNGDIIETLSRTVYVAGGAANAEIIESESTLIANGRDKPIIALRLTDKEGFPLRKDSRGQFRINAPYKLAKTAFNTDNMLGNNESYYNNYTVGENGTALIHLEPTTRTDKLKLTVRLANNKEKFYTTRLKAELRDWVIVGLAEGTLAQANLAGNIEPLTGDAADENLYSDGRISLFAKGQVSGKWLMTLAYDSAKRARANGDPNIGQTIDPGSYYTLYGDTAYNGREAVSSQKLYLKLERDQFYFLFGDYNTDFNDTQLSKYSRTLTGIKSRYEDETYDLILFASETSQSYVKDEFRGEGRSGPYQLSRKNIAMNTEQVVLEIRDRFHSEKILDTITLNRHSDYDINYADGSLVFRKPVFSIDKNLDHLFIVIKYEAFDNSDAELNYGGRATAKLTDSISVGVTHVNEGRTGGKATLDGIDADILITENTQLHLEMAQTEDSKTTGNIGSGKAYIAELKHQTKNSSSKVYIRENEEGFGLGQTNGSENGSRKMGAETSIKTSQRLKVTAQAYRQENTVTEASREVAETKGEWNLDIANLRLGLRNAKDILGDGSSKTSEQITSGASKSFFNNKVTARIDHEETISRGNSIDFPTRTLLGLDYRIASSTSLFIEQERSNGETRDTRNTLIGLKSSPWTGGNVYSGLSLSQNNDSETTSANLAADHSWKLNDRWTMNFGAEESRTLSASSGTALNNNVPMASADGNDFTAGSIGVNYTPGSWMWSIRLENRNGTLEDSISLATSIQSLPSAALSTLVSLDLSKRTAAGSKEDSRTNIRLGMAYRPKQSRWMLLDKLDLKWDDSQGGEFESSTWRAINMFNANYKKDNFQLSLQYSIKTVKENIANQDYKNLVDLTGFETRYDLSHQWDIGLHASVLNARNLNNRDFNSGVSIGRSVGKNIWISVGYNFEGFRDDDFSAADYTSKGMFLKFRMKFDQQSVKEGMQWLKK